MGKGKAEDRYCRLRLNREFAFVFENPALFLQIHFSFSTFHATGCMRHGEVDGKRKSRRRDIAVNA